jgi:phosphoribosylglycinamide formyltransferase 1
MSEAPRSEGPDAGCPPKPCEAGPRHPWDRVATMDDPLRLGILVSGSGTNLQSILDLIAARRMPARVAVVISNREDAYALERARQAEAHDAFIDPKTFPDAAAFNAAIADELRRHRVELVVMAGYMKLLGVEVLEAFPSRVINLHPALLPSFPGAHGMADALDYGVRVTGVTVHFADASFDTGPIILQEALDVLPGDDEDSLAERVHPIEHRLLPRAIELFALGRLTITGRYVLIEGE